MPPAETRYGPLPGWLQPGDPWLPEKMRQHSEILAAERELAPLVEQALAKLLAEARRHAGGTVTAAGSRAWPGRNRFWLALLASLLFGPVAALFVLRFRREFLRVEITVDPDPLAEAFWDQLVETLAAWPDQIMAEVDREKADGGDVAELLDINAPNRRTRQEMARLRRTAEDAEARDSVRREARARLAALRRRVQDGEDSHWRHKVLAAVRNLVMAALNAGTNAGATAYAKATGRKRYQQWWSMEDASVRAAHERAHGQVCAVGKPFLVGGFPMRYPLDPLAPADLVVNCRCSLLSMTSDQARKQMSMTALNTEPEGRVVRAAGDTQKEVTMSPAVEIHEHEVPESELPPLLAAGTELDARNTTVQWEGVLAPLGMRSGDNRMLAAPPEGAAPETRDLPLPLMYMEKTGPGHDNAVVVGRIDEVWVDGGMLRGRGVFDLENDTARDVVRQIDGGYHRWVSVRVDKATSAYLLYRGDELVDASQFVSVDDPDVLVLPDDVEQVEVAERWRLMNAVIVAEPAFQEAVIGLVDDLDDELVDELDDEAENKQPAPSIAASQEDEDDDEFAGGKPFPPKKKSDSKSKKDDEDEDDEKTKNLPPWLKKKGAKASMEEAALMTRHAPVFAALAASAGPLRPPADWFQDPDLAKPTPLTVTDDGRIFGHAAVWGTPHVGYPGRRVTPPRGADYSRFHHGVVRTRENRDMAVGVIVLGADHAPVDRETTVAEAMAHYAHSGYGVAVVRAGEDEHGVWINGAVCPDVDELRLAALRRCSLSGDWRSVDGTPSFISALAVNVPGFPTPREQTDDHGVTTALVAAGVLMPERTEVPAVSAPDTESAKEWARVAFTELQGLLAAQGAPAPQEGLSLPEVKDADEDNKAKARRLAGQMNEFAVERFRRAFDGKAAV